ncbi:MAG: toll/interleukin-1 receptor domain-containing protein, partial [Proteobacteria bacterium]|nr:toll/interleukin-1 receptor domain-containing protein [Pseudomonadota bacterium]
METTSFKNRNWNRLLSEIEDQKIIPIVGPELLIMELDDRQILYYDYIAQKLIEKLNIDTDDFPIQYGLSDVAVAFIKAHGDPADIYFEIREIINSRNWTIPEPLKLLSEIGHFNLFLSITFDSFMEQALNSTRFGGNKKTLSIVYSNRGKVTDLPLESTSECVVFQLFGKASSAPDYAVTEDDLLLFNHRLQSQDQQPLNLFDRLKSNYLLTMGCSFQDWLARFFFCATKGDVLFSDVGMRGVIVDKKTITDEPLNKFLKRRKTLIYPKGNAAEFVKELHHRWTERYRNIYRPSETKKNTYKDESNPFIPEAAFLSYASEDKDFAISIKAALESVGVDVWFD